MKWTKKQLKEFWGKKPENEKQQFGSFEVWCNGVINEDEGQEDW